MKDVLSTIARLREARGWTEYQLAENSGLPQSTISSWYRKRITPTVPSLEKVCIALGITLSQLFSEGEELFELNEPQKKILACWSKLTEDQKNALLAFLEQL